MNTNPYESDGKYVVSVPAGHLKNAKVKLTYSDGSSEILGFLDYNKDGYFIELFIYTSDEKDLMPGMYKGYVAVGGNTEISLTVDVEVRDTTTFPLIKGKGSKTIPFSYENSWVRFRTGSSRVYKVDTNIKGDDLLLAFRKKYSTDDVYAENGKHVFLQPNTEYVIYLTGLLPEKKYKNITYMVKPDKFDISNNGKIEAELKAYTASYTGKPIKMGARLMNLGVPLKLGKDYTISYKNHVKIGNHATVIFTGKGDYKGTFKKTFRIVPKKVALKSAKKTSNTSAKLTWGKVAGATGYTVYRTTGKKWVKVADVRTTSFTDKGLKKGTRYKYRVRAYGKEGKKNIYGSYSSVKAV